MAAFDWIAERSPTAADYWLSGLRKAVAALAERPLPHPLAVEASEKFGFPIREALHGKRRGVYRVFYTVEDDVINVLAIRHSAQDELEP